MIDIKPYEPDICDFLHDDEGFSDKQKRMVAQIYEISTGYRRTSIEVAFSLLEIAVEIYKGNITPWWLCSQLTRYYRGNMND